MQIIPTPSLATASGFVYTCTVSVMFHVYSMFIIISTKQSVSQSLLPHLKASHQPHMPQSHPISKHLCQSASTSAIAKPVTDRNIANGTPSSLRTPTPMQTPIRTRKREQRKKQSTNPSTHSNRPPSRVPTPLPPPKASSNKQQAQAQRKNAHLPAQPNPPHKPNPSASPLPLPLPLPLLLPTLDYITYGIG